MQLENTQSKTNNEINIEIAFKQYELLVKEAARISQARGVCNGFYSTLFFAVFAVVAKTDFAKPCIIIALFILMTFIALVWLINIETYKKLNSAKFEIINGIEKKYLQIKPFTEEWDILQQLNKNKKEFNKYFTLSFVEKLVPFACGIASFVLLIITLLSNNQ